MFARAYGLPASEWAYEHAGRFIHSFVLWLQQRGKCPPQFVHMLSARIDIPESRLIPGLDGIFGNFLKVVTTASPLTPRTD